MTTGTNPTSLHILLQGMHSHDVEQIVQGCNLIRTQLEAEASQDEDIFNPSSDVSQEVRFVVKILAHHPTFARVRGGRDNNLPLHIAAQMGNLYLCDIIFKAYPEAVKLPNKKGKLPLHSAARNGHADVVSLLIKAYPKGAAFVSKKRKLPLHFSVSDGHVRATQKLLEAYPDGVRSPSAKGKLALHLASRWGHIDVVRLLLDMYPEGARFLDWEGSLPIHDASLENQEDIVTLLMATFPEGLQTCNIRGELPLLAAVRNNNPALAYSMLELYPEAGKLILQSLNETDRVSTLHWNGLELCLRAATGMLSSINPRAFGMDTIRPSGCRSFPDIPYYANLRGIDQLAPQFCTRVMLVEVPDQGLARHNISQPGDQKDQPTHGDLKKRSNEFAHGAECRSAKRGRYDSMPVAVSTVATTCQTMVNLQSFAGDRPLTVKTTGKPACMPVSKYANVFLPMHAAIHIRASFHVLQRVLTQCSDQVFVQDCFGRLPLHLSSAQCPAANVVFLKQLLRAYPSACLVRDVHHRLPLHLALLQRADPRAVLALIAAYPSSAFQVCRTRDAFFRRKPLVMAMASDCDLNVIFTLLRGDPSAVDDLEEAGV
jgi:ankyrin repeat protein